MVVVVAILGVVAAVVWPRFAALESGQNTRDFQSALMRLGAEARLIAIETGQLVQVTYDQERRAFVFATTDLETAEETERRTFEVPGNMEVTGFLVDNEFAAATDWSLQYAPDGSGPRAGIEVEDGAVVYHVTYKSDDGSATRADGRMEEASQTEWQAGELENRTTAP